MRRANGKTPAAQDWRIAVLNNSVIATDSFFGVQGVLVS